MLKTLSVYVDDAPGVLNRVASLFRRRSFNIMSLTVGHTERPGVSRMTIVVDATGKAEGLIAANLYKLVNVIDVQDVTSVATIDRDLALIRVAADHDTRPGIMKLAEVFRGRVVDVAPDSLVVEITGTEDKIDGLVDVLRPYGVLEMVRTGRIAMPRGRQPGSDSAPEVQDESTGLPCSV